MRYWVKFGVALVGSMLLGSNFGSEVTVGIFFIVMSFHLSEVE